jgi:hypothetical protein
MEITQETAPGIVLLIIAALIILIPPIDRFICWIIKTIKNI